MDRSRYPRRSSIDKHTCNREFLYYQLVGNRILYCIFCLLLLGCTKPIHHKLPKCDIFQYTIGDTLLYRSNLGNLDTLVVDEYSFDVWPDSWASYYDLHDHQSVKLHFLKDEDLVKEYDSIYSLYLDCIRNDEDTLRVEDCNEIYDLSNFMSIYSHNETDWISGNRLEWKKHPEFDLYKRSRDNVVIVNETKYDSVYILHRDENFIDSSIIIKTIYFNFEFGVIKYENQDAEVFEFFKKI